MNMVNYKAITKKEKKEQCEITNSTDTIES